MQLQNCKLSIFSYSRIHIWHQRGPVGNTVASWRFYQTLVGYLLQNCSKMKFWKCEHKLSQSIRRLLKTFQKIWTVQDLSSWPVVVLPFWRGYKISPKPSYIGTLFLQKACLEKIAILPLSIPCTRHQKPKIDKSGNVNNGKK